MRAVLLRPAEHCPERASRQVRPRTRRHRLGDMPERIAAMLNEWRWRSRSRRELARLDARMLRDIGVTPGEVVREINKPFWRA